MTADELVSGYAELPVREQAVALARLAVELTVLARDGYEVGGDGLTEPRRVREVNETLHRVAGHLVALLDEDAVRYPDDALVRIVLDHPGDPALARQIARALGQALRPAAQPA